MGSSFSVPDKPDKRSKAPISPPRVDHVAALSAGLARTSPRWASSPSSFPSLICLSLAAFSVDSHLMGGSLALDCTLLLVSSFSIWSISSQVPSDLLCCK